MAWISIKGLKGRVYVPQENAAPKKHGCPDCFCCQNCGEERCNLCRTGNAPTIYNNIASKPQKEVSK